ncbi:MAG: hypothetical protein OXH99_00475 [Bryobacterales bacterium]|nr:hypothetical protein [Bryobacterales bacterium]
MAIDALALVVQDNYRDLLGSGTEFNANVAYDPPASDQLKVLDAVCAEAIRFHCQAVGTSVDPCPFEPHGFTAEW